MIIIVAPGEKGWIDTKSVSERELVEAFRKIDQKQWKGMSDFFENANDFVKAGGMQQFLGGAIEKIKEQITLQVESLFAPITNEINAFIIEISKDEGLRNSIKELSDTVGDLLQTLENMGAVELIIDFLESFFGLLGDLLDKINDLLEAFGLLEEVFEKASDARSYPESFGTTRIGMPQGHSRWYYEVDPY